MTDTKSDTFLNSIYYNKNCVQHFQKKNKKQKKKMGGKKKKKKSTSRPHYRPRWQEQDLQAKFFCMYIIDNH